MNTFTIGQLVENTQGTEILMVTRVDHPIKGYFSGVMISSQNNSTIGVTYNFRKIEYWQVVKPIMQNTEIKVGSFVSMLPNSSHNDYEVFMVMSITDNRLEIICVQSKDAVFVGMTHKGDIKNFVLADKPFTIGI